MTDKQKINFIDDQFKNYKIKIYVEENIIEYYNSNNNWLGSFYLKRNQFYISYYWFYNNNLKKHFKDKDEMYEFSKPFLEKIIGRLLMR